MRPDHTGDDRAAWLISIAERVPVYADRLAPQDYALVFQALTASGEGQCPTGWAGVPRPLASKAGIGVVVAEVAQGEDFSKAFATIRSAHPDGLIVSVDPLIGTHGTEVIQFAATSRLPAIYDWGGMARQGGLIAYAFKYSEHFPIAAEYVDKILKGADPADLPVQQPARFELVINRKTANALGLAIPRDLLSRADEVIE